MPSRKSQGFDFISYYLEKAAAKRYIVLLHLFIYSYAYDIHNTLSRLVLATSYILFSRHFKKFLHITINATLRAGSRYICTYAATPGPMQEEKKLPASTNTTAFALMLYSNRRCDKMRAL